MSPSAGGLTCCPVAPTRLCPGPSLAASAQWPAAAGPEGRRPSRLPPLTLQRHSCHIRLCKPRGRQTQSRLPALFSGRQAVRVHLLHRMRMLCQLCRQKLPIRGDQLGRPPTATIHMWLPGSRAEVLDHVAVPVAICAGTNTDSQGAAAAIKHMHDVSMAATHRSASGSSPPAPGRMDV
jgi:hypothetical protein